MPRVEQEEELSAMAVDYDCSLNVALGRTGLASMQGI
jgi:hypothetical protein